MTFRKTYPIHPFGKSADTLLGVLFFCLALVALVWSLSYALDKTIEAQDKMLCASAEISGNAEYLHKCHNGEI